MQNLTCSSPGQGCPLEEGVNPMTVHQGDCVNLDSDDDTYQVIGVDGDHDLSLIHISEPTRPY